MKYFVIEPEVPGNPTFEDVDREVWPPRFNTLAFKFLGWIGDDLVTGFPVYLVSEALKNALSAAKVSGVWFDTVEVIVTEQFEYFHPDTELPQWHWLRINGEPWVDAVWQDARARLVVREDALQVFQSCRMDQATVLPAEGEVELVLPE